MVASFYKSIKYYWITHFKWLNGGACGLHCKKLFFFFFLVLQYISAPSTNTAPFWGHNVIKRWGLASRHSKANKEAKLVERKVCFTLDASNQASCPKAKSPHWQHNQWARVFVDRRRELRAEIAQSALTIIMTLVISGQICIIWIVQLIFSVRGSLFPFLWGQYSALWPLMSYYSLVIKELTSPPGGGVSVSTRQLPGDGRMLSK